MSEEIKKITDKKPDETSILENKKEQNDTVIVENVPNSQNAKSTSTENNPATDNNHATTIAPAKNKRSLGSLLGFDEIKGSFKRTKEQNKDVKKFAILGVIFSLCSVALVYPCFYGGIATFNFLVSALFVALGTAFSGNIVLIFLIGMIAAAILAIFAIALFLLPLGLALLSLILPIVQLVLNRKWWGWVSLVIGVCAIPSCILVLMALLQTL